LEPAGGAREGRGLTYLSPLGQRYASPAMQALWGERRRIGLWRRLWLALMEAERELGLDIPDRALAELRAHLDDADLERAAEHEKRLRHDVMAHIHHLGEQAPAARPFLHLGATSAYVTDNADLILMREGLQLLLGRVAAVVVALSKLARRYRDLPCLAYTHFQPAQLTTVGKRVTLWMQELLLDAEELLHRLETFRSTGSISATALQQLRCYFISKCNFPANPPPSTRVDGKTDIRAVSDPVFLEKASENTLDIYQQIMWNVESRYGPVIEVYEVEGTRERRIVIGYKMGGTTHFFRLVRIYTVLLLVQS